MKLMALSFVRTSELWREVVDLEAARCNIPSQRMKMRVPHLAAISWNEPKHPYLERG
jgi:hypothetical protein